MTKNQKFILLLGLLLGIGFILFLIYRPDIKKEIEPKEKVYTSYKYTTIKAFFPSNNAKQIVSYTNINLAYNEETEQAEWVCYLLTKNHLNNPVCKRSNRFKSDLNINSRSASSKDYYKSGYDRGHLAPAADMLWSDVAMIESFLMSNISPQKMGFNRGIWKKLEGRIRKLALIEDSLVIITGPLFLDSLGNIGLNEVVIPSQFYKIIIDISAPQLGALAFVIPNRNTKLPLDKFVITIDSLENISHLDFLAPLDNDIEQQLEGKIDESLLEKIIQ